MAGTPRLLREVTAARQKYFLRNYYKRAVLSLPAARRRRESVAIARRLSGLKVFQKARTVALYLSLPHEVDTRPLLSLCRQLGKEVVVPVVSPEDKRMDFLPLPPGSRGLRKNVYGIPEPRASRNSHGPKIDLLVVPGRAFTRRGDRLGSGGGYYDRFLALHPRVPTVGIAYSAQVAAFLPLALHDRPVKILLTA